MVNLRAIDDVDTQKKWIDNGIIEAFKDKLYKGKNITLAIRNPVIKEKEYTLDDQKKALLGKRSLSRSIIADVELLDNETGKVLEKQTKTIAMAPYHTGRNTTISNGNSFNNPSNQLRLEPGAYTRKKANDEIETHFNLVSGTGSGFRINMDPQSGVFGFRLGTSNVKLYSLLKAMGISDDELKKQWGIDIFNVNKTTSAGAKDIIKLYEKLVPFGNPNIPDEEKEQAIITVLNKAKMNPNINKKTLGFPHENVTPQAILDSTKKIVEVSRGEQSEVDRDSLLFKSVHSSEDFYKEKVEKDAGDLGKFLAHKLDREPTLDKFPPGYFTKQLWGVIKSNPTVSPSGTLSQPLEEINPLDVFDQHHKITLLGEGGIGDINIVTDESRNVHPSEFGFIDYMRATESLNVGIDKRTALGVKKGDDNKLYAKLISTKTGKEEWLNPLQVAEKVVAFPLEWKSDKKEVAILKDGKIQKANRDTVDYYFDIPNNLYSTYNNLVPLPNAIQGNRMVMAGKALGSTLPLKYGEAPLVQSLNPATGNSYEKELADKVVNKTAKVAGMVTKIDDSGIYIKDTAGTLHRHGLYNNYPLNRKTGLTNNILVKVGDLVKKNQLLAHSNFSDKDGVLNMGLNLLSAYIPYKGHGFEDGIIISESAAKKLTSEQLYTYEYKVEDEENQKLGKNTFLKTFPSIFTKPQIDPLDDKGVVKPGTKIQPGDPIILSLEKRPPSTKDIQLGNLHRSLKNLYKDATTLWDHHSEGEVIDVHKTDKLVRLTVKTNTPANIGDKLTGRFGNKGVISVIIPDDKMPVVKELNKPLEIILNPLGIPSRINPAQMHEAKLGLIAEQRGAPFKVPSFQQDDIYNFVKKELKENELDKNHTLYIPEDNRDVNDVLVGKSYIWKLSKLSEGEIKKREIGTYDIDEQPVKGKGDLASAIRIGHMEVNALQGHNAKQNLHDISVIKGQSNPDFWRALKFGEPLPSPRVPFVYDKFITMLKGAGVDVEKRGVYQHLLPLTDKRILQMSTGKIDKPELLYAKNMMPIKGGLFDMGITGGTVGKKWSHIELSELVPNPVMETPIKKILGINQKQYDYMIQDGSLANKVKEINIDNEIKNTEDIMASTKKSQKDDAIKRMAYLKTLKENGLSVGDLMLKNIPVIPPVFRPISVVGSKQVVSPGSANLLYKDLIITNSILNTSKEEFPDSELGNERLNNYKAVKAVVGLGDPLNIKNKSKGAKGFISTIVGDQPKTGFFQHKVYSKTQDLVSRGVATPDPSLSMNEISIPRDAAWRMFKPFVLGRMIQQGIPAVDANNDIINESPRAFTNLCAEMKERPILMNRNPSLQKYNVMGFYAKINNDNVIKTSPPICVGFKLDHDGDQVNLHIPSTPEAVREVKEIMMPSKNLFHLKDKKVHYLPAQGAILGLYSMTQQPTGKKIKKVYNSMEELKEDYLKGTVKTTDLVEIRK